MSELQDLLDRGAALSPDEVVTEAKSRDVTLPHGAGTMALITLDNGFDHTRPEHVRAQVAGVAEHRDRRRARPRRRHRHRRDRQAVHPGRGSRPDGADRPAWPRRRAADRPARARGVPQARRRRQAVVRVRQRARARRRPRGGAALHLPDRAGLRARPRPARGHARAGARLGWCLPAAQPRRRGHGREADPREPAQPGPHPRRPRRLRGGPGRRRVPGRRLPGAVAALGRPGAHRRRRRRARPRWTAARPGTPRSRKGRGIVGLQDRRRLPRRLPRARPDRRREDRRPATRASPPRTRRSPT